MPWFGSPTSYASGYISAHRTVAVSQSLTTAPSSPPTYWMGLLTCGSSGSSCGNTVATDIKKILPVNHSGYPEVPDGLALAGPEPAGRQLEVAAVAWNQCAATRE